jgi:hypothetical protein
MGMALILVAAWLASYFADCDVEFHEVHLTSNSGTLAVIYSFPADTTSYTSHLGCWEISYWAVVIPLETTATAVANQRMRIISLTEPRRSTRTSHRHF